MSSALDDILARVQSMPSEDRAALEKLATDATAGMKWLPNPGPQTEAYFSPADVLLYGGQGGGGKTDLGLGLALTAHKRSLILRRKYANLSGLTERALEINGTRDGFNGSPPPLLRTSDRRYVQFAGNQHLGDEQDWQGQPFDFKCVGRGTLVLLPDGSYLPIEDVQVGDVVQTLEGPRRVTKVFPVRRDAAVRVVVRDSSGALVCSQDQSLTHEVLTPEGWVCHDTSSGAFRLSTYEPNQSGGCHRPSLSSALPCGESWRPLETLSSGLLRILAGASYSLAHVGRKVCGAFEVQRLLGIDCEASCGERRDGRRLHVWSALRGPWRRFLASGVGLSTQHISGSRACGVRFLSALQDSWGHCSFYLRRCGARVLRFWRLCCAQVCGLICLLQSSDVGRPSPICFGGDASGETPRCNRHKDTYCHPYTKEIRQVALAPLAQSLSCESFQIGEIELYDIEVEEVNHFITFGGLINKNCFDEATQFLELQIRFHIGWLRSTEDGQRVRAVLATNPPIDANGDFIIGMFRPWLDLTHHKPAKSGELRWYVTAPDGSDLEVSEGELGTNELGRKVVRIGDKDLEAMSRTFIPAALKDNPYLINTGYQAKLDGLPEPIRSAVRDGNFMAARDDADNQVIPTSWIIAAQDRWTPRPPEATAMTAMAIDPAGGGGDAEEVAHRYGGWYGPLASRKGADTKDGAAAAGVIFKHRKDSCPVIVDVGGGYGGAVILRLRDNSVEAVQFNGAGGSTGRAIDGSGRVFANKRAEAWWRFREALDPDQEGGSVVALPPDPELRSDLAAPTFKPDMLKIQIESKDDIRKRIGRSPGKGDAVVMALSEGTRAVRRMGASGQSLKVNLGHTNAKRRR